MKSKRGFTKAPTLAQLKPTPRERHLLAVLWDWQEQCGDSSPNQKRMATMIETTAIWTYVPGRAGAFGQAEWTDPDGVTRLHTFTVNGWADEGRKPCSKGKAVFARVDFYRRLLWLE